jgi:hypothetical protein
MVVTMIIVSMVVAVERRTDQLAIRKAFLVGTLLGWYRV